MSEDCREIEALLSPYLDGELDAEARRRVEAHVAACDACRATLEEWRRAEGVLRSVQPARSDVEWERLAQRVEAAIDVEDQEDRAAAAATVATGSRAAAPARPAGRRWWLWGGSGALVAAALVSLFWPWVVPHPTEPPMLRTSDGGPGVGALQKSEAGGPATPSTSEPKPEELRENAAAPAIDDARRGQSAPETPLPSELDVAAVPEKKSRADAAEPPAGDAKEKADAPNAPPSTEADRSKGSYGLMATEAGRLEAEKAPTPAAPAENAAPRAERAAAAEPMQAPWTVSQKSLVAPGHPAPLDEDRARAAPDSSFAPIASKVAAAIVDGSERVLADAAGEVDAFLAAFPQSPHRVDALADRMRLLARLSAPNPDRWCESARLAVDEWQRAAHDPAQDLQDVAKEIDERCGGWGD